MKIRRKCAAISGFCVSVACFLVLEYWQYNHIWLNLEKVHSPSEKFKFKERNQPWEENSLKCPEVNITLTTSRVPVTVLASYPGSGNTWTRYLLQQATGFGTGSVFCDADLLKHGFPFECNTARDRLLVVKTHSANEKRLVFEKVLLIVRNPYDALLSHFNFKYAKGSRHVGNAPVAAFREDWKYFVRQQIVKWQKLATAYLDMADKPVHLVIYEYLKSNLTDEIRSATTFLNAKVPDKRMKCILKDQEGRFHRGKKDIVQYPFELYPKEFIQLINQNIDSVSKLVKKKYGRDISFYKR